MFIYLYIYVFINIYIYIYSGTHGKYSDKAKCSWAHKHLKSDALQVAIQLLVVTIKEIYNIIIIEYIIYTLLVFS